ncbi:MAG: phage holin family protein [Roseburia sp.]|nr:phage holin family protein [Roseburia sp.]
MDISFLLGMVNPLILGMCLAVGYVLKIAFEKFPNRYIPLAALSCGTLLSIILHWKSGINAEILLGGMISGLASTGLYEMLRNLLKFDGKSGGEGESGGEDD